MKQLSRGDIAEVTGLKVKQLDRWRTLGIVQPIEGGRGQGRHCRYTPMQAVGLVVADAVWGSPRGCQLGFCGQIVESFARLTEDELRAKLDAGHFGSDEYDHVDVAEIFERVTQKISQTQSRLVRCRLGRSRGLAATA